MIILKELLPSWQQQGHRALLFCQTRQMLDIVEAWVRTQG
jgi:DNA excision repair protein ERCC-6